MTMPETPNINSDLSAGQLDQERSEIQVTATPPPPPPPEEQTPEPTALDVFRETIAKPPPAALKQGEVSIQKRTALVGIGIGTAVAILAYVVVPPGSMIRDALDPNRYQSLIPLAILWMFFWGVAICHYRRKQHRALLGVSRPETLSMAAQVLRVEGRLEPLSGALSDEVCQHSPLLRRLQAVVRQWLIDPGLQDANVVLQHHNARDADALHRNYVLVRVFVWALPVLGLIGTVLGIADAVGGFANFLGGDVTEVAPIREKLVEVTGGLSFAFLITLQGLLTSLITMLIASTLQNREEKLYAQIDQGIADEFLPVLQHAVPPAENSGPAVDMEAWRAALHKIAIDVSDAVRTVANETIAGLKTAGQESLRKLDEATAEAQRNLGDSVASVAIALDNAASAIPRAVSEAATTFSEGLKPVSDSVDQIRESTKTERRLLVDEVGQLRTAIDTQLRAMESAARMIEQVSTESHSQMVAQMRAVETSLQQVQEARLGEGLTSIASTISQQSEALQQATTVIGRLGEQAVQVLAGQQALEDTLRRLQDGDFRKSLDTLGSTLDGLRPVLQGFQRPFVLQAVAVEHDS